MGVFKVTTEALTETATAVHLKGIKMKTKHRWFGPLNLYYFQRSQMLLHLKEYSTFNFGNNVSHIKLNPFHSSEALHQVNIINYKIWNPFSFFTPFLLLHCLVYFYFLIIVYNYAVFQSERLCVQNMDYYTLDQSILLFQIARHKFAVKSYLPQRTVFNISKGQVYEH